MNLKRVQTTVAAGILAASMILPGISAFAAPSNNNVTNATTNAEITKVVQAPAGVTYDETFTYTFAQRDTTDTTEGGIAINQDKFSINSVTITAKGNSASTDATTGDQTETLTGKIDLSTIDKAGVYTYTVTETNESQAKSVNGATWTYDEAQYKLRVYATWKNSSDKSLGCNYVMTLKKLDNTGAETGDKLATATFTNTLTKASSFTLTKTATDTDGIEPTGTEYTFTVTINPSELTKSQTADYKYTIKDKNGDAIANKSNVSFTSGTTIALESGQTATFTGVPAGSKVTVKESDNIANVDYTKTVITTSNTDDAGTLDAGVLEANGVLVKEISEDGSMTGISYSNTWKTLTVTGVVTNIAPYVTLVVVAGAAIAAYVVLKRRMAR